MEVKFSKIAELEFDEIVYYFYQNYGRDKAIKFTEIVRQNLKQIKIWPESFSFFQETNNRKCVITPSITVIYKINAELHQIEILNFWFNRSNPNFLLKHL